MDLCTQSDREEVEFNSYLLKIFWMPSSAVKLLTIITLSLSINFLLFSESAILNEKTDKIIFSAV